MRGMRVVLSWPDIGRPLGRSAWDLRDAFIGLCILSLCLFSLCHAAPAAAQSSGDYVDEKLAKHLPKLTGRVVDGAGILSAADEAAILKQLEALDKKSSDQFVVVTVRSLKGYPIEQYGVNLGRHWGIGRADKNNGVLLIVAPNERKVRIEVGRGLEGELTDALSSLIIQNAILPKFRGGDMPGGIKAGVRDVIDVLLGNGKEVKKRAAGRKKNKRQDDVFSMVVFFLMLILIIFIIIRSDKKGLRGRRGRNGTIYTPSSSSGSWSGRSSGGFSGSGGSFGGGGSSGSW